MFSKRCNNFLNLKTYSIKLLVKLLALKLIINIKTIEKFKVLYLRLKILAVLIFGFIIAVSVKNKRNV